MESHKAAIAKIVLADGVSAGGAEGYTKDWDIAGDKVTLIVVKA